jgi:hypothetical protein
MALPLRMTWRCRSELALERQRRDDMALPLRMTFGDQPHGTDGGLSFRGLRV